MLDIVILKSIYVIGISRYQRNTNLTERYWTQMNEENRLSYTDWRPSNGTESLRIASKATRYVSLFFLSEHYFFSSFIMRCSIGKKITAFTYHFVLLLISMTLETLKKDKEKITTLTSTSFR